MRKTFFVVVGVVLVFCACYGDASESFAQSRFAFGIKPGMTMQTSYFGFTAGRFLPYASMDMLWMSVKMTETRSSHDTYYGNTYDYWEEQTFKGKAVLFIPHFGAKWFVHGASRSDGLRAYLNADLYLSIPSVSGEEEKSWRQTYNGQTESGHWSKKMDKDEEELIEDVLSFWGFNLGFGTEYMFSEHFSVGGEYGFRLFFNGIERHDESSSSYGNPGSPYYQSYQDEWDDELRLTLRMNYAVVALNFYF
jgi:hypothetical protein